MGGWVMTGLGVGLAIVIIAGTALAVCRRYCIGWQLGTRNIWSIWEEWRQRLSWLWAPREEKVGLVKAQHPTGQTIPGLYRQSGNSSQLLHSDSDLRLDAQGAFTRFEAVDRDLHPPLGLSSNTIPPQPLRPAPQPKSTVRPRPTPLQGPGAHSEYIRMEQTGPAPLTPPPILSSSNHRNSNHLQQNGSVFLFHNHQMPKSYSQPQQQQQQLLSSYNNKLNDLNIKNNKCLNNIGDDTDLNLYKNNIDERIKDISRINRDISYRQYDLIEDTAKLRYGVSTSQLNQHGININSDELRPISNYTNYELSKNLQQQQQQQQLQKQTTTPPIRQHVRNDSRSSFNSFNFNNSNNSIYGSHQTVTKLLQNTIHDNQSDLGNKNNDDINMIPFRNSSNIFQDDLNYENDIHSNSKIQGLQRVSQYIQSLPDVPIYDGINDQDDDVDGITPGDNESAPSPVPPPAPPDPPNLDIHHQKNGLTTGERIFNALRSVTSQSYIDASEFYNSILTSAQQVPMLTFPTIGRSSLQIEKNNQSDNLENKVTDFYIDAESDTIGMDGSRRTSDLYSPELNLEAHRTAQEVYNSLQDPPSSPLLLKDQEPYPYMSDPSFTRTSEDIFNSLEQRRKSMEILNGLHDYQEMEILDLTRRRSSQELHNAFEEVQLKRRLSQSSLMGLDSEELIRRGSQGPEPEPPPDEANLKHAISCESVCSDTSVVLNDIEQISIVGHVCVGMEFERWGGRGADCEGDLVVSVLEARDLICSDGRPAQDTLARICLLPDRTTFVQTRCCRGSPSPSYQEKFLFPLDGGPIGRTLLVEIFSIENGIGREVSLLGEASLKLGSVTRPPATTWLPLISPALPFPHLGELMFSLSYLPTAERLTLVVVKARNLLLNTTPGEFFVKVYLLQQGKKIHKKKTSSKRGEVSPTFNEAIIFNVPAHTLQTIQLRLTVAEVSSDTTNSKPYSVGHVIVGSNATGKSKAHWRQMLSSLRRPIVMWHPLRK